MTAASRARTNMWQLLGVFGTVCFGSRWLIQMLLSRRSGASFVPREFWIVTLIGSAALLTYFSVGPKSDLVGFLNNVAPATVAIFNLCICRGARGRTGRAERQATPDQDLAPTLPPGPPPAVTRGKRRWLAHRVARSGSR